VRRSQIYKRGYAFRRGPLLILMFQQEQASIFEPCFYLLSFNYCQGRS